MASILLILLIIIFVIIITLLSLGTYILSALFGGFMNFKKIVYGLMGWNSGNTQTTSAKSSNKASSKTYSNYNKSQSKSTSSQGKMFDKDEGTYIDFEDVK